VECRRREKHSRQKKKKFPLTNNNNNKRAREVKRTPRRHVDISPHSEPSLLDQGAAGRGLAAEGVARREERLEALAAVRVEGLDL